MICFYSKVQGQASELLHKSCLLLSVAASAAVIGMWRLIQRLLHRFWKPKGVSSEAQPGREGCWAVESNLFLFQTWKEFWPETWKTTSGWNVYGATSAVKTDPWLALLALPPPLPRPPSANTTMPHWHDWYDENCWFLLKAGSHADN